MTAASDLSHWHATAPDAGVPADDLPMTADVAVIGGGILGAATAYFLARGGVRPALIERETIGWGATGRNGGFVTAGAAEGFLGAVARVGREATRAVWRLTLETKPLLRGLLADEGFDCDYREPGSLSLALSDEQYAGQQRTVAALQAEGFPGTLLDRAGVQERINTPLGPEIRGGLYGPENGLVHSAKLVRGLAAAARKHGARLCQATVTSLTPVNGATHITTSRGAVAAGAVIVAANAWTDELVPTLAGVITPVRGQVLAYAPLPRVFTTGVGAAVTPTGEYWQQALDGTIVLGGCRAVAPGGEVGLRECATAPAVQAALEGVFPRLFPQLANLRVARRWAGLMAFTPDYLPVADRAPGLPAVWVAGGFCGHGMPFGIALGKRLAEAATSDTPPVAIAPLRLDRPTLAVAGAAV
jgi:gamma-glutamylputrescine oxidase